MTILDPGTKRAVAYGSLFMLCMVGVGLAVGVLL
jgi:hypothetical protein